MNSQKNNYPATSYTIQKSDNRRHEMAKIWRNRIIAGDQEFSHCPTRYRSQVLSLLRQDVEDGVITAEQFEKLTGQPY